MELLFCFEVQIAYNIVRASWVKGLWLTIQFKCIFNKYRMGRGSLAYLKWFDTFLTTLSCPEWYPTVRMSDPMLSENCVEQ